jgi:hypothetical protein
MPSSPLRRALLLVAAAAAIALACDAEISLVDIDHAETLPVPSQLAGQTLENEELPAGEGFDPLASPEMEQYGGTAAAVGEAFIVEAQLAAIGGAGNLDFLDAIEFHVTAPGVQRELLASQDQVPKGKSWIALDVNQDLDLTDFVGQGNIQPIIVVSGTGPDQATELEVSFTLSLGVSVASACESLFEQI